ncbi:hypothetical protein I350_05257 [Cryptococcus amylolentus CBS 6273]|uniref:Uncharacterized protein n=1 Tax=Cryptococcus amylolentus CBS 6273 TaxID=1296118 RepID=A0A1E3JUY3_9TREE|nr:hypothetical protein I350_05257 [Cryptococcus amylolentus CBS 6273]
MLGAWRARPYVHGVFTTLAKGIPPTSLHRQKERTHLAFKTPTESHKIFPANPPLLVLHYLLKLVTESELGISQQRYQRSNRGRAKVIPPHPTTKVWDSVFSRRRPVLSESELESPFRVPPPLGP